MFQRFNPPCGRARARRLSEYSRVLAVLLLAIVAPSVFAQAACNVIYTISPQNSSAFGGAITIQNTGTTALTSWNLTWTFANGQTVASLWNGVETQSGAVVTVKNQSYNGSIAAGGSLTGIGFNGTWNGTTNAVPTSFAVNGTTCGAPVGSFTLRPSAATLSIAQGSSGTDTITVTDVSPFAGAVTLAATGLPTGVTAAFATNPTTGSSVLTFAVSSSAAAATSTITINGTSGTLRASTTIALTVTSVTGSFSLRPSAAALSIAQGSSGTDTITVTDVSPFAGAVTLAATGLPTGVTAAFGTNPTTGSSMLTLTASSAAAAGTSTVTITGTSGTLTASTTLALTVTGTCTPTAIVPFLSVNGGTTWTQTSAATVGSTSAVVDLGPQPITGTWNWTGPNGFTSTARQINSIALSTGANIYVATYTNAAACKSTQTFTITVTGGTGSYTLSRSAATLSVMRGSSATDTITVNDLNGFTGAVTLGASGLPAGVTAAFATNPSTASSVLTLTASATATVGASTVTITGTSGSLTATTTIALTVTSTPGSFTLSRSAPTLSIVQGASGTNTITVTDVSPFAGSVTLAATGLPAGVTAAFATNPATATSVLTLTVSSTAVAGASTVTINGTSGTLTASTTIALTVTSGTNVLTPYQQHFIDLWTDYHNPVNGYFSPQGVPYHSVETLMVEAPDYGHETVSETYSYYIWLETMYGGISGNWAPLQTAWTSLETYMIPSATLQPTNSGYNPSIPAQYAPEFDSPSSYPATQTTSVPVGTDPLFSQLHTTYGNDTVYGMHWIIDSDNWYGFGQQEDGVSKPSCINTYQRGPMESVWLTIPQPCWENFTYGGPNGYLDIFAAPSPYTKQYKYTDAPDADARAIQAIYWAHQFATAQGGSSIVTGLLPKAAKMGDFLRYSFFDKYFKTMGCQSTSCAGGSGYNSSGYLLAWYYAWGGAAPSTGQNWAWRIGASGNHFGYQNPVAAYALSTDPSLIPLSPQAKADWTTSLARQIEFYRWLQSSNGAIAGGATNSWDGAYSVPPAGTSTFYSMSYTFEPVYHNPPSNQWFGMQVWSMERVAEYYYITGDAHAKIILDPWIAWVEANTKTNANGTYTIPGDLSWSGQPALNWNATTQNWTPGTAFNSGLTVTITSTTVDVGETGALCKALSYYSAGTAKWAATQDLPSQTLANTLLQDVWTQYRDSIGISAPETRKDYTNFNEVVYVPPTWGPGTMPNGDPINTSSTFLSLRTKYETDPNWPKVSAYLAGGAAPVFNYHRFWAQVDIATAYAVYARLFPGN